MKAYYDGTKLLSLMDINGNPPEIYICTSNRTAGKTTYFGRYFVNRFYRYGEKFGLLYRYASDLKDVADKFYKDIGSLFFPGSAMTAENTGDGAYYSLSINGDPCGYAIALNAADKVKQYSHMLSDIKRLLFDEFQSENNKYCPGEIKKFISVHTSIARGQGEQVRRVPVFMLSNPVTLLNPYYIAMGISDRLQDNTRFLRGDGYVMEQGFNEEASDAQKTSGFNRAFAASDYVAYAAEGVYLNDNKVFIETPKGKNKYILTLKVDGVEYGLREYPELGIVYCDKKPDYTFPVKLAATTDDHQINYVMLQKNGIIVNNLRFFFNKGAFRFRDLQCKSAILKTLSY